MALYFLSLLVVKLCHAISCTNQMILFSCTWKRTSLPNHVHLWGVTAEQRAVIYSLFFGRLSAMGTTDTPGKPLLQGHTGDASLQARV